MDHPEYAVFLGKLSAISKEFVDNTIAVAVSGGSDSIFLLSHLAQIHKSVCVLHVNYGVRVDSDVDAQFVSNFSKTLGAECLQIKISDLSLETPNFECLAREKRYTFFEQELERKNIPCLLTAHHRDDLVETLFVKLLRGSGNLFIDERRFLSNGRVLFRPMLNISKNIIEKYLQENQLSYRQDESNTNTKFLRNFIRQDIVPVLKKRIAHFNTKISNFSDQFAKQEQFIRTYLKQVDQKVCCGTVCDNNLFIQEDEFIQYRLLEHKSISVFNKPLKRKQIYYILNLLRSQSSRNMILYSYEDNRIILELGKIFFLKDFNKNIEKKKWIIHNDVSDQAFGEWRVFSKKGLGLKCEYGQQIIVRSVEDRDHLIWGHGYKKVLTLLKEKKIPSYFRCAALVLEKNGSTIGVLSSSYVYIIEEYRCLPSDIGLYFEYLGKGGDVWIRT